MQTGIELLHAFDFSECPEQSFGDSRVTPWRSSLPYSDGLRVAVEHLQESDTTTLLTDWRYGMYRFQVDLVMRGYLQSFHLETGRTITSRLTFPATGDEVLNPVFYRFAEPELHYFIIGFHPSRLVGVYFPERKQVVSLMNHDHPVLRQGWEPERIAMNCVMLEELLKVNPAAVEQYCANEANHRLVLTQSFHPNAGHQLREEFPLLWKLYHQTDCNLPLLTGPRDVLNLRRRLPDRVRSEEVDFAESDVPVSVKYFMAVLERGLTLGRMGCSSHMPAAMQAALQENFREEHAAAHEQLRSVLGDHSPVIWLTLRQHNRKWVDEGARLRQLVEAVLQQHPNAAFILDGMPDTRVSADAIMASRKAVFDRVGVSFTESQALFSLADAYVMPYSNSCTFHMVTPRPGVVHGLKGWIPEDAFEPAKTEDPLPARVVHGTRMETGNDTYDEWVTTCDYELPPEPVIEALLEVLAELPASDVTT
jgi:hypothetical protein